MFGFVFGSTKTTKSCLLAFFIAYVEGNLKRKQKISEEGTN
jgi:hypothetical protein